MKININNNLLKTFQWILLSETYLSSAVTLTKANHFENTFTYLKFILT